MLDCPAGLAFNALLKICDWKWKVAGCPCNFACPGQGIYPNGNSTQTYSNCAAPCSTPTVLNWAPGARSRRFSRGRASPAPPPRRVQLVLPCEPVAHVVTSMPLLWLQALPSRSPTWTTDRRSTSAAEQLPVPRAAAARSWISVGADRTIH